MGVVAVVAGDLVDTLASPGPFTVFAPTNDAFDALPAGTLDSLLKPANKAQLVDILTYHVLPEQILSTDLEQYVLRDWTTVEGKDLILTRHGAELGVGPTLSSLSKVTAADNLASNGVVHIIDGVLLPQSSDVVQITDEPTSKNIVELAESASKNIVELAESVPTLSTLVVAAVAGDLVDTLASPGPFTIFAPTNDAFDALPAGTLDSLLKPANKAQLVDILTYHVLPEQILSTDLEQYVLRDWRTAEGKDLILTRHGAELGVGPTLSSLS